MKTIPVVLLTGFLGSGKTTLLSRLLGDPAFANSALVINEFGEVSIDHLAVANLAENIVELRDGCLCCTIRGDLALTLRDLHQRRILEDVARFERVIVETSGLADPVPLVHTLMANPPLQRAYHLDSVVAVVDAEHADEALESHETARSQVALADIVVVSKLDRTGRQARGDLELRLRRLNPSAEILEAVHGRIEAGRVLDRALFQPDASAGRIGDWLAAGGEATPGRSDDHDHGATFETHAIVRASPLSLAGTSVFLNRVVNDGGENLLRIKGLAGFVEKGGKPALLHAVRNKFYPVEWLPGWPDEDHSSRLVFIGRKLDTARIDELFRSLCV